MACKDIIEELIPEFINAIINNWGDHDAICKEIFLCPWFFWESKNLRINDKCENVYFTSIIFAYSNDNLLTNHSLMNLSQILGANN